MPLRMRTFHWLFLIVFIGSGAIFLLRGFFLHPDDTSDSRPADSRPATSQEVREEKVNQPTQTKESRSSFTQPKKPLSIKPPKIQVHSENMRPEEREAAMVAARFHWLMTLSNVDSDAVIYELQKITTPELFQEIRPRFEVPKKKQRWKKIDVYRVQSIDGVEMNTIAEVNGEELWLYERLVKEGGQWKVEAFSNDLF